MIRRKNVVIKDFDEKAMYCPSCLSKLEAKGYFRYEDVCGLSIGSTKWMCPSKGFLNPKTGQFEQCLCNKYETFWNDGGDFFSGREYRWYEKGCKKIEFIHGPDTYAAFNSFAKDAEVSIYGKNLKRKIYLHPALCLWVLRPFIEFHYKSNPMGDILKRTWKIQFLKKSSGMRGYGVLWVSPFRMIKFCIKKFHREVAHYKKHPDGKYAIQTLYREFEEDKWDKRWWRKVVRVYQHLFYFRLRKKIQEKNEKLLNK